MMRSPVTRSASTASGPIRGSASPATTRSSGSGSTRCSVGTSSRNRRPGAHVQHHDCPGRLGSAPERALHGSGGRARYARWPSALPTRVLAAPGHGMLRVRRGSPATRRPVPVRARAAPLAALTAVLRRGILLCRAMSARGWKVSAIASMRRRRSLDRLRVHAALTGVSPLDGRWTKMLGAMKGRKKRAWIRVFHRPLSPGTWNCVVEWRRP